jgi:hypothetical protein
VIGTVLGWVGLGIVSLWGTQFPKRPKLRIQQLKTGKNHQHAARYFTYFMALARLTPCQLRKELLLLLLLLLSSSSS